MATFLADNTILMKFETKQIHINRKMMTFINTSYMLLLKKSHSYFILILALESETTLAYCYGVSAGCSSFVSRFDLIIWIRIIKKKVKCLPVLWETLWNNVDIYTNGRHFTVINFLKILLILQSSSEVVCHLCSL